MVRNGYASSAKEVRNTVKSYKGGKYVLYTVHIFNRLECIPFLVGQFFSYQNLTVESN